MFTFAAVRDLSSASGFQMHFTAMLLAAVALFTTSTLAAPTTSSLAEPTTPYGLVADYSGAAFFDAFDSLITNATIVDPTSGAVNYVSMRAAVAQKMVGVVYNATAQSALSYVGVETTGSGPSNRNSVRLESKATFGINTLLVADIRHMPVGCGLWPAFWALGQGAVWPAAGEIDVVETVHTDDFNHVTLHTSPECVVDSSPGLFQGNLSNTDCSAGDGSNGCSVAAHPLVSAPSTNNTLATAGAAFNAQGGAVYALLWTAQGISIYIFAHGALPADLAAGTPDPSSWTAAPLARFRGAGCDFTKRFAQMQIILNTDLCGSWAGADDVWQSSGCKASTGVGSCQEFVSGDVGDALDEAYWLMGGIKVFSMSAVSA